MINCVASSYMNNSAYMLNDCSFDALNCKLCSYILLNYLSKSAHQMFIQLLGVGTDSSNIRVWMMSRSSVTNWSGVMLSSGVLANYSIFGGQISSILDAIQRQVAAISWIVCSLRAILLFLRLMQRSRMLIAIYVDSLFILKSQLILNKLSTILARLNQVYPVVKLYFLKILNYLNSLSTRWCYSVMSICYLSKLSLRWLNDELDSVRDTFVLFNLVKLRQSILVRVILRFYLGMLNCLLRFAMEPD